jgi:flagellar M-ring protein FliF
VNVVNTNVSPLIVPEPLPEPPLWQQPWVWDLSKQLVGLLFAGMVIFSVLRPAMRQLVKKDEIVIDPLSLPGQAAVADAVLAAAAQGDGTGEGGEPGTEGEGGEPGAAETGPPQIGPLKDDADLEAVKAYVRQEPKIATQVVKAWLGTDE